MTDPKDFETRLGKRAYVFATETDIRAPASLKDGNVHTSALGVGFAEGARWGRAETVRDIVEWLRSSMVKTNSGGFYDGEILAAEIERRFTASGDDGLSKTCTLAGMPIHVCPKAPDNNNIKVVHPGDTCPFCGAASSEEKE